MEDDAGAAFARVCTTRQTGATGAGTLVDAGSESGSQMMLLTVAVLLSLGALAAIARQRVPGGVDTAELGWMSESWLADYRASHPFNAGG